MRAAVKVTILVGALCLACAPGTQGDSDSSTGAHGDESSAEDPQQTFDHTRAYCAEETKTYSARHDRSPEFTLREYTEDGRLLRVDAEGYSQVFIYLANTWKLDGWTQNSTTSAGSSSATYSWDGDEATVTTVTLDDEDQSSTSVSELAFHADGRLISTHLLAGTYSYSHTIDYVDTSWKVERTLTEQSQENWSYESTQTWTWDGLVALARAVSVTVSEGEPTTTELDLEIEFTEAGRPLRTEYLNGTYLSTTLYTGDESWQTHSSDVYQNFGDGLEWSTGSDYVWVDCE